jgi:hypothetical protein
MPQPTVNQSVDPTDPTQPISGQPVTQTNLPAIIIELQNRIARLEAVLQGGVLLTDPAGDVHVRLSINASGNPTWTRI